MLDLHLFLYLTTHNPTPLRVNFGFDHWGGDVVREKVWGDRKQKIRGPIRRLYFWVSHESDHWSGGHGTPLVTQKYIGVCGDICSPPVPSLVSRSSLPPLGDIIIGGRRDEERNREREREGRTDPSFNS